MPQKLVQPGSEQLVSEQQVSEQQVSEKRGSSQPSVAQQEFLAHWRAWQPWFDRLLANTLRGSLKSDVSSAPLDKLVEAIVYSSLAGGKRLRALLVYLVADCCSANMDTFAELPGELSGENDLIHRAALSIEMVHCYSLIHDDLPSMDDDDMRRGQPTCHIAYGEAMAILAGDGLHSLAFELLSDGDVGQAKEQLALINSLSRAAGTLGMVGGQAIDLASENVQLNELELTNLHRLKTGRVIEAAVELGAISAGANSATRELLDRYAKAIGLAFQIRDDIIDITSSSEQLGKPQGADQGSNKSTFPSLLGLEEARERAEQLYSEAIHALDSFDEEANLLRGLAEFFVRREH